MQILKPYVRTLGLLMLMLMLNVSCNNSAKIDTRLVEIVETNAAGEKFAAKELLPFSENEASIQLDTTTTYQTILGIGGSFTKATAVLFKALSPQNQQRILAAYFGEDGAQYSLCRTHINSCDFSPYQYAYLPENETDISKFSLQEENQDLVPMMLAAKKISPNGFNIIASPWTAPPWMKTNNKWVGGELAPEHYQNWANYLLAYVNHMQANGLPIWGLTVENEPLGNDNNWESMHFTPTSMNNFVGNFLGPTFEAAKQNTKILGFDQNRDEALYQWVDAMYADNKASKYYDGIAVHWYASTISHFPDALRYAHKQQPNKYIIQTEGCIDAEPPRWQNDQWYWEIGAKDWGFTWAPDEQKHLHPPYVPVFRYASDIIGCLNNHVNGWIDWNMILNKEGGPNWAKNWCIAPVIVDTLSQELYFTPLFEVMKHFSKYIKVGSKRIGLESNNQALETCAIINPNGNIVVIVLNKGENAQNVNLTIGNNRIGATSIGPKAIQTISLNI